MSYALIDPNIPNIKWPIPFNKDANPIGWAYYIYIKNSKSINTKSIKKFINERYFDYEDFFCINKIDEHFFLKFGKRCKKFSYQVYERMSSKQRFIDNICVEFDKPVKVFTFEFEDYEIPSPPSSPTETKTFDFPSFETVKVSSAAVTVDVSAVKLAPVEENRIGYVFIDHSNIIYGAKNEGYNVTSNMINEAIETNSPWICKRYIVGSGMFSKIIKSWEHMNYVVDNSPNGREYDVDAILHSKIINTLQTAEFPERSKLILATGDGNCHREACSFPKIVEMALDKGWTVELYSWRISLSKQFFKINHPGFKLYIFNELEPFKSQTYILSNRQKLMLAEKQESSVSTGNQRNGSSRNGTLGKIIKGIDISRTPPAQLVSLLISDFPPLK
jgi:hypothetical protein